MASELMALMFSLAGGAGSFPAGDDEPAKAHLSYEVPVVRFGGPTIRMADADGDGKLDVLVLQAPGQLQCSEDGWGRRFPEDRKVYCLTAATLQGKVLWQDGEPDRRPDPFISHGAGDQMVVGDIDGDGKGEVAVVRMDE